MAGYSHKSWKCDCSGTEAVIEMVPFTSFCSLKRGPKNADQIKIGRVKEWNFLFLVAWREDTETRKK